MKKPFLLREFLIQRTPWLNTDPDHLVILIENGQVALTGARSLTGPKLLSHEPQYTLQLTLLDFEHDPEEIIVPLLEWLTTHQPDYLDDPEWQQNGLSFDLVVIDKSKVDFTLRMRLTEHIIASIKDETAQDSRSRYAVKTADEPQRADLDEWMRTGIYPGQENTAP